MNRWRVAVASFVVGVALSVSPSFAEDVVEEALPGIAAEAAPEYSLTQPKDFPDVKLANAGSGGYQSVAVNPKNPNVYIATFANQGACWVRTSFNAGRTWAAAKKLPMTGKPDCSISSVFWAPDGTRVYAAYSYRSSLVDDFDFVYNKETGVLFSSSTDGGLSWSNPSIAAKYTEAYDSIASFRIAAPLTAGDARWVYILITWSPYDDDIISIARSADRGRSWFPQRNLEGIDNVMGTSGSSIAAGRGGEVLIAWRFWYCDRLCEDEIQIRRSNDHGASFQRYTIAPHVAGETALAFGIGGTAHLVYSVFQADGPVEKGIYYTYSTKAPYTSWSAPRTLNDELSGNNYHAPALTVSRCGEDTSVLHAAWLDDRAGVGKFNVYYTRKVAKTGKPWSPNLRVSPTSPVIFDDFPAFIPTIAAGSGTALGVWGQRRWNTPPRPVWASRIAPGVSCP
jgi:hypothetical protein